MNKYRVAWKALHTGIEAHGEYCLSKADAEAWTIAGLQDDGSILHWIERESTPAPPTSDEEKR